MTKISKKSTYPIKTPVVRDYFVGTDSEDNLKTVNFGFEETANFLNELNGLSNVNYKFITSDDFEADVLTKGNFLSSNNETAIPSITKLYVNNFNHSNKDLSEVFNYLKINSGDFYIRLQNSKNLNNSVYFNVSGIESYDTHFILNVVVFKSNPYLLDLINYDVYFFAFHLKSGSGTIVDYRPDELISLKSPLQEGNTITISALDAIWRQNQLTVTNQSNYSTTIASATNGYYRIDIIGGYDDGTLAKIQGVENIEIAIKPDLLPGMVEILTVPVFGTIVLNDLPISSASVTGLLSLTDWNTFNSKQPHLDYVPEDLAKKQNNLNIDGTGEKYPTVDAINEALSTVQQDKKFVYNQTNASSVWSITHNLQKRPSVTVVDTAESYVIGQINYINDNQVTITFSASFSGYAYFN